MCMRTGQMWPYVDAALSERVRQVLEPKLRERRARWMLDIAVDELRLPFPQQDCCIFGRQQPQLLCGHLL